MANNNNYSSDANSSKSENIAINSSSIVKLARDVSVDLGRSYSTRSPISIVLVDFNRVRTRVFGIVQMRNFPRKQIISAFTSSRNVATIAFELFPVIEFYTRVSRPFWKIRLSRETRRQHNAREFFNAFYIGISLLKLFFCFFLLDTDSFHSTLMTNYAHPPYTRVQSPSTTNVIIANNIFLLTRSGAL